MVISVTVLTFSHPPVVLGPVVQRTPQAFEIWHCLVQSHPDTCLRERQPAHCVNEMFFFFTSYQWHRNQKKKKTKIPAGAFTRTTSCSDRDIASKHNNCFSPSVLLWLCSTKQDLFITSVQLLRYHCLQRSQVEVKVKMNEEPVNTHTHLNEPHVDHAYST